MGSSTTQKTCSPCRRANLSFKSVRVKQSTASHPMLFTDLSGRPSVSAGAHVLTLGMPHFKAERATGPWQQKSSLRVQASRKQSVLNAGSIAVLACLPACDAVLTLETDGSQVEAWGPLHWVTIGWRFGWQKPQTSWSEMQVASARHPSPPFAAPLHRHSLPLRAALRAPWLCL
jgi:hypothetical protein